MKLIIVSGPTATGKTDTSLEIATQFKGEVVNFDSLLLYKEISIGTAKPSLDEQKKIPHHMIDVRSISNPMNAADYARESLQVINTLLAQKKTLILTGGSGFYLQALLKGMYQSPTTPKAVLDKSESLYKEQGIAPFIDFLKVYDPASSNRYHENDHYRIRRAVEHYWSHGSPLSNERLKKDQANQNLKDDNIHGWELLHLYLDIPKEEHAKIIEQRTKKMIQNGLYEEVKNLLNQGFSGLEKPLQSIGYKEMLDYHFKVYSSLEECMERICISTRQLAKSPRTWFNREKNKLNFNPLWQRKEILTKVDQFLN